MERYRAVFRDGHAVTFDIDPTDQTPLAVAATRELKASGVPHPDGVKRFEPLNAAARAVLNPRRL